MTTLPDDTRHPDHPNQKVYRLFWTDTGAPYAAPGSHKLDFHLDAAMQVASFELVTVKDENGSVIWVATRAARGALRAGGIAFGGREMV